MSARCSLMYQLTIEQGPQTIVYLFCYMGKIDASEGLTDNFTEIADCDRDYFDFFTAEFHQHFNAHDLHKIIKLISQNVDFTDENWRS